MRQLELKALIARHGGQRQAARDTGISITTINLLCNGKSLPRKGWAEVREKLAAWLHARGAADTEAEASLTAAEHPTPDETTQEDDDMILRKQQLAIRTRKHFRLMRDPFDDPQSPEDVYFSPESRYVQEFMRDTALNGGFCAIVGESGSGKSTLREDLIERLKDEGESVIVIEPYMLSVSGDRNGKPLLAPHIAESIIATLAPGERIPRSQEMRDRKLHQVLKDSNRAGNRHVLIIEEAHDLHGATLKALKRFWELKDGLKRLLAILLIGQTELMQRFGGAQVNTREVWQRCVPVELPPIQNPADFLAHRFSRVGADVHAIFEDEALTALRDRLMVARDAGGHGVYMGYPLAISNYAVAAMNLAASLGERTVTADVVRQVRA